MAKEDKIAIAARPLLPRSAPNVGATALGLSIGS